MKKIIIALVVLLLVGGGAGAFFLLQGAQDEAVAAEGAEAEVEEEPQGDPIYLSLNPAFLVNFDHNGTIRYLQVEMQVMARDQDVIDKVQANMPAVRNKVILLLSDQKYDDVSTVEGKDNLRQEVLAAANEVLQFSGKKVLDEVFFTSFVIQ